MNPDQTQNTNNTETKPVAPKQERVPIKSLRTFQGDVQEAIEKNKYSSTTILVKEQERKLVRPELNQLQKKSSIKNNSFLLFGTLFIVLGIASVLALYYVKPNNEIQIETKLKTLITFSEEKKVSSRNVNREDFLKNFSTYKNSWNSAVNSVLYINPTFGDEKENINNIISFLGPSMPPSLTRSFDKDYMMGIYSFDTNEVFIILTIEDYSLAYPGMLKWEKDMPNDLSTLFNISMEDPDSVQNNFIDETIKNRDMRVLKDSNGRPLITYSFIDRKTLVITKNEPILSAIVGKILLNKQVK